MPKINESPLDQAEHTVGDAVSEVMHTIVNTTMPIIICGVSRKINIGNFENVDVYSAITLPLNVEVDDIEALKEAVIDAAELGFALTSQETGQRYTLIKEMQQRPGRPTK